MTTTPTIRVAQKTDSYGLDAHHKLPSAVAFLFAQPCLSCGSTAYTDDPHPTPGLPPVCSSCGATRPTKFDLATGLPTTPTEQKSSHFHLRQITLPLTLPAKQERHTCPYCSSDHRYHQVEERHGLYQMKCSYCGARSGEQANLHQLTWKTEADITLRPIRSLYKAEMEGYFTPHFPDPLTQAPKEYQELQELYGTPKDTSISHQSGTMGPVTLIRHAVARTYPTISQSKLTKAQWAEIALTITHERTQSHNALLRKLPPHLSHFLPSKGQEEHLKFWLASDLSPASFLAPLRAARLAVRYCLIKSGRRHARTTWPKLMGALEGAHNLDAYTRFFFPDRCREFMITTSISSKIRSTPDSGSALIDPRARTFGCLKKEFQLDLRADKMHTTPFAGYKKAHERWLQKVKDLQSKIHWNGTEPWATRKVLQSFLSPEMREANQALIRLNNTEVERFLEALRTPSAPQAPRSKDTSPSVASTGTAVTPKTASGKPGTMSVPMTTPTAATTPTKTNVTVPGPDDLLVVPSSKTAKLIKLDASLLNQKPV